LRIAKGEEKSDKYKFDQGGENEDGDAESIAMLPDGNDLGMSNSRAADTQAQ